MIFKLRYSEEFKNYYLEPYAEKFNIPNKVYGKLNSKAIRVWNTYVREKRSTGVLLVGDQGSGKSLTGNILSNIAIDNGLPVIMVSEIQVNNNLIAYLSNLKNCVLYLDEFGKLFYSNEQASLLTMLSDPINTKKIIILTENTTYTINRFILNRPGRIRYRYDFNKLERDDLLEYLHDNQVEGEFLSDLVNTYETSTTFSFDILSAIVNEHRQYPTDNLKSLLNTLNVKIIAAVMYWRVTEVKRVVSKDKYEDQIFSVYGDCLNRDIFKDNLNFNITIHLYKDDDDINDKTKAFEVLTLRKDTDGYNFNMISITDNTIILKRKKYEIKLELKEKDYSDDSTDNINKPTSPFIPMPMEFSPF